MLSAAKKITKWIWTVHLFGVPLLMLGHIWLGLPQSVVDNGAKLFGTSVILLVSSVVILTVLRLHHDFTKEQS